MGGIRGKEKSWLDGGQNVDPASVCVRPSLAKSFQNLSVGCEGRLSPALLQSGGR